MTHARLARLTGESWWLLPVVAAVGVLVAATWALQAVATAHVFGTVLDGGDLGGVTGWIVVLGAVVVSRPVLTLGRELLATVLMTRVKLRLRDRLSAVTIRSAARDAGRGRTGHDHALVVDGVENLDAYLGRYLPQLLVTGVVVLGVAAGMATVDPVVAAGVGLAGVLLPLVPRLWDRVLERRGADHWQAYQDLHAEFVDSMQGMTTLVVFDAAERRQVELAAASDTLVRTTMRQLRVSLVESGLNGLALALVPLLAVTLVYLRRDTLGPVEAFVLVLLAVELVRPFRDLASLWHAGYLGTFSGREILTALDNEGPAPAATHALDPAWRIDGVTVTYPGAAAPALRAARVTFGPGLTAVVGPSGGGKSTLVGVLAGLLTPDADGGAVRGPRAVADGVALVPQDPVLFAGTVRDNIALALDASGVSTGPGGRGGFDVEDAARLAGIGTDDPTLALDSPVGERGALVSGGQRQRVAVARALVQGRDLLVLDEATSALDARSERDLVARLREAVPGGLVVVAHRPGAVADADRVIRVEDGRIVEAEAGALDAARERVGV